MEKEMATQSSTLAWKIPWTEEPRRLQSMGSLSVEHDWVTSLHFSLSCIGEGNGNPLQCSCLENPRDRGAWWAAVCGVAQSRTQLKRLSSSSSSWKIPLLPSALRAAGNLRGIFSCTFYTMENPWSCFVYEATECSYSKMSFQTSGIWWKENNLFISFQASVFSALQIFFLSEWIRSTNFPPYLQI